MTGSDGQFQVSSADLMAHAGEVDSIGNGLAMVRDAGNAVRLGSDAYGKLCQIVPDLLSILQTHLIDGIAAARDAAHNTAEAVRSTAADYDNADANAEDRLRRTR